MDISQPCFEGKNKGLNLNRELKGNNPDSDCDDSNEAEVNYDVSSGRKRCLKCKLTDGATIVKVLEHRCIVGLDLGISLGAKVA